MEVWSGTITSRSVFLDGIRLINPSSTNRCDLSGTTLSLQSLVDSTSIPLLALTGPVLEVHVVNSSTGEWIKQTLLSNVSPDKDEEASMLQCPIGILVMVEDSRDNTKGPEKTNSLLIYGVVSLHASTALRGGDSGLSLLKEIRVYAAPLSSALITKARSLQPTLDYDFTNGIEPSQYARFLCNASESNPKRKRADSLFEAAYEYHKNVRKKGVVAVSEYIEKKREASPLVNVLYSKTKKEHCSTTSSSVPLDSGTSRAGFIGGRTSSLSKQCSPAPRAFETNISDRQKSTLVTPVFKKKKNFPTHPTTATSEDIITANKACLTRTILTCLRLYGYHRGPTTQRTKPGSIDQASNTIAPDTTPELLGYEGQGFKAMYHATYRASTFALRRFLHDTHPAPVPGLDQETPLKTANNITCVPMLEREKATEVVDSILKLFCEDSEW
ncbi:hypothetical protein LOZ61_004563 [Ophidiomyces ophidiicola]|nr:hypothetical protein LOZ61_004563 [Ophidiomyces ophidiicola]KAI1921673.1 hypothetical protein LOZ60_006069 [Ophidiomyces ophidiicola]KAI2018379.1 hypothetical protein LOZ45_005907 [Ophidiomyces ophidiicola]KAI2031243.1 hypothetical protein LOZ48_002845 [Ophidiomyces ophidiicola]KAI2067348.1 hypothetical protein LOZ40_003144 [Ophidiomyces ophidiicola]